MFLNLEVCIYLNFFITINYYEKINLTVTKWIHCTILDKTNIIPCPLGDRWGGIRCGFLHFIPKWKGSLFWSKKVWRSTQVSDRLCNVHYSSWELLLLKNIKHAFSLDSIWTLNWLAHLFCGRIVVRGEAQEGWTFCPASATIANTFHLLPGSWLQGPNSAASLSRFYRGQAEPSTIFCVTPAYCSESIEY